MKVSLDSLSRFPFVLVNNYYSFDLEVGSRWLLMSAKVVT